jgi:hypothetical protein
MAETCPSEAKLEHNLSGEVSHLLLLDNRSAELAQWQTFERLAEAFDQPASGDRGSLLITRPDSDKQQATLADLCDCRGWPTPKDTRVTLLLKLQEARGWDGVFLLLPLLLSQSESSAESRKRMFRKWRQWSKAINALKDADLFDRLVQLSQRSRNKPCQGGIVLAWLGPVMKVAKAAPQDSTVLLKELVDKFEELGSYSKAGWDAAFERARAQAEEGEQLHMLPGGASLVKMH